jgi:tRNA uracil 4-sulfurtransferase
VGAQDEPERLKAVVLLSDGIDSPVTLYKLVMDGWDVVGLHMDNRPFTSDNYLAKVRMLVERVEEVTGATIPLYIAGHGDNQERIANELTELGENAIKYQCVLCKRQMYRVAQTVAEELGAHAIATGESLGQVASQTIHNLAAEEEAVTFPMVRPLLGLDKEDIIEVAKEIGTYEISIIPSLCCSIVPEKPQTRAKLEKVLPYEEKVGPARMLADAINKMVGPDESREVAAGDPRVMGECELPPTKRPAQRSPQAD